MLTALFWQLVSQVVDQALKKRRFAAVLAKRIRVPDPTPADRFAARRELSQINWTKRSPAAS